MQKQVLHNQSVLDCLLQHTGSLNQLMAFVITNGISITSDLKAGDYYEFPNIDDDAMYNYFYSKNTIPATAITTAQLEATNPQLGIGSMIIKENFIVG